jgi:hypothetical protein
VGAYCSNALVEDAFTAPENSPDGPVSAMLVHDDGSGEALYVGGRFFQVGGVNVANFAKWDGSAWSAVGDALNDQVLAMTQHDDGSGNALFVAGNFNTAGGVQVNRIAKWDGSAWSALGDGFNNQVLALTSAFIDGEQVLVAAGRFTRSGTTDLSRIAKWDGSSWTPLGSGMDLTVRTLAFHDDGSGATLFAGGDFALAGGVVTYSTAKYMGNGVWAGMGEGLAGTIRHMLPHADDTGTHLYAAGNFTDNGQGIEGILGIAKWDGSAWQALGNGLSAPLGGAHRSTKVLPFTTPGDVVRLASFNDGVQTALYAAGDFTRAGNKDTFSLAKWQNGYWYPLGEDFFIPDFGVTQPIEALATWSYQGVPALYFGGNFTQFNFQGHPYMAVMTCPGVMAPKKPMQEDQP